MSSARETVARDTAARREDLIALSHRLHAHPETAWEEHRAAAWVGEAMAHAGFDVTPQYLGLDTAVRATAGSGPLHVVLCAEYDALPGLGHAWATTSSQRHRSAPRWRSLPSPTSSGSP